MDLGRSKVEITVRNPDGAPRPHGRMFESNFSLALPCGIAAN
jgi:hypothetical protein